jgi:hypothetical protein
MRYKQASPVWHFIAPVGLFGIAVAVLAWAWTMLDQHEYGAAMLLAFLFLMIGVGSALAIQKRVVKLIALSVVVAITVFSGVKIWIEKGTKPWSVLLSQSQGEPIEPGITYDRRRRTLTQEQRDAMKRVLEKAPADLRQHPQLKIIQISLEDESRGYADQIASTIRDAGWDIGRPVHQYPGVYYSRYPTGITVLVDKDEPTPSLAYTLSNAFTRAGINHVFDTGPTFESEIVLVIGTKGR